jgi:hypothetical protein
MRCRGPGCCVTNVWEPARFFVLAITRPLHHALGLRSAFERRSREHA